MLFFKLFHLNIPHEVIGVVLSVALVVSGFLYRYEKDNSYKRIILVWIVACLFMMLYCTVLGRTSHDSYNIHLMPFWSIQAVRDGYIETLYEKINNVIFFMPYGFLLDLRRSNCLRGSRGMMSLKGAMLIGFITSVTIELLQLFTRTGTCEPDDVICNTLGCAVGAIVVYGLRFMVYGGLKWFKRYDK